MLGARRPSSSPEIALDRGCSRIILCGSVARPYAIAADEGFGCLYGLLRARDKMEGCPSLTLGSFDAKPSPDGFLQSKLVRAVGLEPTRLKRTGDFKSPASTIPPRPRNFIRVD
ncbi:hypothetical protein ERY430_40870 [Erythrobacter sp. EC-HK427]|nr:hypothetical protein ERY430_40870 [Erythrobacter sp. EC-HK427]